MGYVNSGTALLRKYHVKNHVSKQEVFNVGSVWHAAVQPITSQIRAFSFLGF